MSRQSKSASLGPGSRVTFATTMCVCYGERVSKDMKVQSEKDHLLKNKDLLQ